MINKPILDSVLHKEHVDWTLNTIQMAKGETTDETPIPESWENPYIKKVALKDQGFRGTCTGFATASAFDLLHMMLRPEDVPTPEDMATYKMDVVEPTGTVHDVLYKDSASAQWFYTIGREEGNITYPSGGDIKCCARAWVKRGMILEKDWFTDKTGKFVVVANPHPELETTFAPNHKADGWAMLGAYNGVGNMTEMELKRAIYKYGFVIMAIPVCVSYKQMEGGDGWFEQTGENDGFHAILAYGYNERGIKLFHSWGKYCNPYGGMTWQYFHTLIDQMVGLVILDKEDVAIGNEMYKSITVDANVTAQLKVNNIGVGMSPQKIALEKGKTYEIEASATGYITQTKIVDDTSPDIKFELVPIIAPRKTLLQLIIEIILKLLRR